MSISVELSDEELVDLQNMTRKSDQAEAVLGETWRLSDIDCRCLTCLWQPSLSTLADQSIRPIRTSISFQT
ncbi:MAG: hypothetical protein AABP62_09145 [Planctomycetota bacterium]